MLRQRTRNYGSRVADGGEKGHHSARRELDAFERVEPKRLACPAKIDGDGAERLARKGERAHALAATRTDGGRGLRRVGHGARDHPFTTRMVAVGQFTQRT